MRARVMKPAVGIVTVLALVLALMADPVAAKTSKVLFSDSLKKPSSAIQPGSGTGYATTFEGGHFVMDEQDANSSLTVKPSFNATAQQLSRISISVDASINNADADAGVVCRRNSDTGNQYELMINAFTQPVWLLLKSNQGSQPEKLGSGFKGMKKKKPNNVRLDCVGPSEPGSTGTVTLKVFINGKLMATVKDSGSIRRTTTTAALPAGPVALRVSSLGKGTFNNLKVTQL